MESAAAAGMDFGESALLPLVSRALRDTTQPCRDSMFPMNDKCQHWKIRAVKPGKQSGLFCRDCIRTDSAAPPPPTGASCSVSSSSPCRQRPFGKRKTWWESWTKDPYSRAGKTQGTSLRLSSNTSSTTNRPRQSQYGGMYQARRRSPPPPPPTRISRRLVESRFTCQAARETTPGGW